MVVGKQQIKEQTLEQYLERAHAVPLHPLFSLAKMRQILGGDKWQHRLSEWINSSPLTELVPGPLLEESSGAKSPYAYFSSLTAATSQTPLESHFFSSLWYNSVYADVSESGLNPFLHYLMSGWKEGETRRPAFRRLLICLKTMRSGKAAKIRCCIMLISDMGRGVARQSPIITNSRSAIKR